MEGTQKPPGNFQPRISPKNSGLISSLPSSVVGAAKYRSLEDLGKVSNDEYITFYILDDSSTEGKLIPMRNDNREFFTILLKKDWVVKG